MEIKITNNSLFISGIEIQNQQDFESFKKTYPSPYGNIKIIGLGLGLDCDYLLSFEEVKKLIVIETKQEIIDLYKQNHIEIDNRLNFICGDGYKITITGEDFDFEIDTVN